MERTGWKREELMFRKFNPKICADTQVRKRMDPAGTG
jgi:hypothetical protein